MRAANFRDACLNIDLISFDQRYYIKSYCISIVWPLLKIIEEQRRGWIAV